MNSVYRNILCCACAVVVASSYIVTCAPVSPVKANGGAGIMRWDTISTPNSNPGKYDVLNPYIGGNFTGSEIRDLSIGSNSTTIITAVTVDARFIDPSAPAGPLGILMYSNIAGISWSISAYLHLAASPGWTAGNQVYNVLISPDDPKLWAVTAGTVANGPTEFWVTKDAGATWDSAQLPALAPGEAIGAIDISVDYGTGRDLLVATRSGAGGGRIFITKIAGFTTWMQQANPTVDPMDFFAVKFSPTYNGDQSFVVILATGTGTFYNIGLRDISANSTPSWIYPGVGVTVSTPTFATLSVADLSLPSDYSGQSASLRRAFVSLAQAGIFRIDDLVTTTLLPLPGIYSIAFFGTYVQGKLIAGSLAGSPCNAVVPTIYMDTPCTCAGSCSYTSLKPPTGGANQGSCSDNLTGIGAAVVAWNHEGSVGYAVTGSSAITSGGNWWVPWISVLVPNDESALSISRNNGDTWNQLALIDTTIDWFNDVAVASDCTAIYVASVHRNTGSGCGEFDSVWRTTTSPAVAAPLPALLPEGTYWERVFTHVTGPSCHLPQSDLPLLRTVPSCSDSSDGGVVAWAAQYTPAQAWSPDYGDYWVAIPSNNIIQDFTFESSKVLYDLSPSGLVQRMVYTGTAWSNSIPAVLTGILGHDIVARNGKVLVGGTLSNIQGASVAYSADSGRDWYVYRDHLPVGGNVHVAFDVDFDNNHFIYAAVDDNATEGTVYRNTAPGFTRWDGDDLMDPTNGATGPDWFNDGYSQLKGDPPHRQAYYGIAMAFTGNGQPALYAAHDNITVSHAPAPGGLPTDSGVCRTIEPRNGIPKPGVYWDCLDTFMPSSQNNVHFTLEPTSLKICGCCSVNTNTTLLAIDNESGLTIDYARIAKATSLADILAAINLSGRYLQTPGYNPAARQGMLWAYTDCLAKKGPQLRKPADKALVGADPVTGRNQQVDLSWEQLCLSSAYQLQIAKDKDFSLRINPEISNASRIDAVTGYIFINTDPVNVTSPAAWIAPGALPEAGRTYYWRIRSYQSATAQIAVSPWSQTYSFSVKPGFIVNTPYLGVQLLAPDNGCAGCKVKPALFSWSPWKEATRYEFQLSSDPEFKKIIEKAYTSTTANQFEGALDYSTGYYWRVRAVEVNGQPIPSDWSATFNFKTEAAPPAAKAPSGEPATPIWVWLVIGVGVLLVVATLALILRTRRQI
jgi:hypothetical protein